MRGDRGSAAVELVVAVVILLLPLTYLVVVVARVQAAAFATEGAARDVVRAYLTADDDETAVERSAVAVALALGDHGLDAGAVDLDVVCSARPCVTPGATVDVGLTARVVLPGSDVLGSVGLVVPVSARHTGTVDALRETG